MRSVVSSPKLPPAIGPYSPGLRVGNLLVLSGQVPLDPASGQVVPGDVQAQARRVLDTIAELLAAAGADFSTVARTTVFLTDLEDFAAMNAVYATYFSEPYPARSTVQVVRLPKDVKVEIDVIAVLD
jgi:2-iminobutanoate/2-iminopropanoate deaminase